MTHLVLIRHGEAEANVRRIVGGPLGDTGLTPRGREQAARLGDRITATREITADVLLSSSLPRARETAEILAPAFGVEVMFDDDLQELRPGEADGMALADAITRYGIPDFAREPGRPVTPGGESWALHMVRVGSAIDRLTRDHAGKSIVIVTHGGFIDGVFVHLLRLGTARYLPAQFATRHASITRWRQQPRFDGSLAWSLVCFNDTTHLG